MNYPSPPFFTLFVMIEGIGFDKKDAQRGGLDQFTPSNN